MIGGITGRRVGVVILIWGLPLLWWLDGPLSSLLFMGGTKGELLARIGYWLGHGLVGGVALFMLWMAGRRCGRPGLQAAGARAFWAFMGAGLSCQVLKHLIGRPRPRVSLESLNHFGPTLASGWDSFPSGHAATSFAGALVLAYYYPRLGPVLVAGAALVAVTRITGGAHFPLDVLGGAALGLAWAWLVVRLAGRAERLDPGEVAA